MKILLPVIFLLLFTSVGLNIFLIGSRQNKEIFKVARVVDGDTLILSPGSIRVRLANIEAPEKEFCGGMAAYERLKILAENKPVTVDFLADDNMNRSLVHIFIDTKMTNEILLAEGLVDYDGSPNRYRDQLRAVYEKALSQKLGIWGQCRSLITDNPKCLIKGNVNKQDASKAYLYPGCPAYNQTIVEKDRGEQWFCTETEAQKAGFVKSKNCFDKTY